MFSLLRFRGGQLLTVSFLLPRLLGCSDLSPLPLVLPSFHRCRGLLRIFHVPVLRNLLLKGCLRVLSWEGRLRLCAGRRIPFSSLFFLFPWCFSTFLLSIFRLVRRSRARYLTSFQVVRWGRTSLFSISVRLRLLGLFFKRLGRVFF